MASCSSYHSNLILRVLDNSLGNTWKEAVAEWTIIDCIEDSSLESSCVCGKENLKYLFTIKNVYNDKCLYPIGSSCIKKFQRADLNDITALNEQLFKLLHAIDNGSFIGLSKDLFSRKLLKYLFDSGAFKPSKFNNDCPKRDFDFLLEMFNKRSNIPDTKQRKINAIIIFSIKPFLKSILSNKIRTYKEINK